MYCSLKGVSSLGIVEVIVDFSKRGDVSCCRDYNSDNDMGNVPREVECTHAKCSENHTQ